MPSANAKSTSIGIPSMYPHMGAGNPNNFPSASQSRIIGYTYLKHNGAVFMPVDSTTYSYSFGRGGQLSHDDMGDNFVNFDHSYTYIYKPATGAYQIETHRFQTFSSNKPQAYTFQVWHSDAGVWEDSTRYIYMYNNDLTLIEKTRFELYLHAMWQWHYQYNNAYNADGSLARMSGSTLNMSFTYDANGLLISREDSIFNFSSSSWRRDKKLDFFYNGNQIASYIVYGAFGSIWLNQNKYEHVYTGSQIATTTVSSWANNNWETEGRHVFTYDANDRMLSDEWQYWDVASAGFKSASRLQWTYNGYGQPTSYYSETFDPSTGLWASEADDFFYRYYYQQFIPMSVDDKEAVADVRLYPIPASNIVNIDLSALKSGQRTLTMMDMQGKIVKQLQTTQIRESIDVSRLAAGTYILQINAQGEQVSKKLVVAR